MGETTKISWTDHTFNPWWGCMRVSPGCENCYAESFAKRVGLKVWGPSTTERRFFGDKHWREPIAWNAAAARDGVRRRVFCASMADAFEDRPDLVDHRARLFRLIEATTRLDWLLLTKRPQNIRRLAAECSWGNVWPENVWIGTTCEDQARADERIPHLLEVPAVVRFVSYEPALELVNFKPFIWPLHERWPAGFRSPEEARAAGAAVTRHRQALVSAHARFLDWIIVGGESGPRARAFDVDWARETIRDCRDAGVSVFFKQAGRVAFDSKKFAPVDRSLPPAHAQAFTTCRLDLRDPKGGDLEELDEDLHVREWPR